MNIELDEKLCADFSEIFIDRHSDMYVTAMCWGFETGDGWEPLIRDICTQLKWLADKTGTVFAATQVKEKYGTMRFYIRTTFPEGMPESELQIIDALAEAAVAAGENRSGHTCETCGKNGRMRGKYWSYTACDAHTRKADNNAEKPE